MATIGYPIPAILRRPTSTAGIWGWITTVDAKRIGVLYGITSLIFLISGGMAALIMRLQLATPDNTLVSAGTYNALFTMHGTVMVFLFIMPINSAFANFLLPLMIGARDVAFPRLNALSYWLFLGGGVLIHVSFLTGGAPDAGWFSYANLTEKPYSPGHGIDYWILSLQILGAASIMSSLNFIVTIINMRCKGMSFMRMPILVWIIFIVSFLLIFSMPIIAIALVLLTADRFAGTNFFVASGGGDPILWQHLFWIFGHPEVYILILPPMGFVSEIIPVFSRKPLFGYRAMVLASVFIAITGFAVWSHHMFAVGLGPIANTYFATATMLVAVPTGVKIFNWIATIWGGQVSLKTPMLFALGFVGLFTIGGISGVMHASPPSDLQQTDTYFIVAHFHYVLFGGGMFGIMAGLYYWFPKITGRMLSDGLGKLHFWLMFIGFNMTFFPMHFLGLNGMPRRVYTYTEDLGFGSLNMLSTVGSFIMGVSFLVMAYNIWKSLKRGEKAGNDPWDANTLEWSIASPPPEHNFDELPEVRSERPLFDQKHPELAHNAPPPAPEHHAHRHIHLPAPSYWPLIIGIAVTVAALGLIYTIYPVLGIGLGVAVASIYAWVKEPPFAEAKE